MHTSAWFTSHMIPAVFFSLFPSNREALRMISTVLHAAGRLLITSATVIRRIIQGADFLQAHGAREIQTEYWN